MPSRFSKDDILRFVEPVYRFCLHRIRRRQDAEDLAGEIILHVLEGLEKYDIRSLDAWVWRIAHNRYARFCARRKTEEDNVLWEDSTEILAGDYAEIDSDTAERDCEAVFRFLHSLSAAYREIAVDYYIGGKSVRKIAETCGLPETTVKWRLNVSRQKLRDRMEHYAKGDCVMEKIYSRLNWDVRSCNGSLSSRRYLSTQIARAICEAAYETPVTIEEISLATGLPTMYIEDALPDLLYGDAVEPVNGKYATNFILLRRKDRERMEQEFLPLVKDIADFCEQRFAEAEAAVDAMTFYGHTFGMARLGYIALPYLLRQKVMEIKNRLPGFEDGPYPPRQDGGYGWFLIEEAADSSDITDDCTAGCNITDGEHDFIYWYHVGKYFDGDIYHNGGTRWMIAEKIPQKSENGVIPDGLLTEEDVVRLLGRNLIAKNGEGYCLNFAAFTQEEFDAFTALFTQENAVLDAMLEKLIVSVRNSFRGFTPKRLDSQINQWVSAFVHRITAYVTDELIARGVLEKPAEDVPLTNGVFYVEGKYRNV